MTAPFFSIFALVAELCVTTLIFYIIWTAISEVRFKRKLAFGVLAYEVIFNISYMVLKSIGEDGTSTVSMKSGGDIALAIFHGTFSLLMFVALVLFFLVADRHYAKGENFFVHHHRLTSVFLYAWGISVFSGAIFFIRLYL